ncbi:MAG: hypothetical protein ABI867_22170 [Kofleriaceae bacterium]
MPACATDGVLDELAGESDADGEAGKGDGEDAFTYFQVAPDPQGAGFLVSRPNRATTRCGDQTLASCAASIDWSAAQLADDAARTFETRLAQGEPILLRGQLARESAAARNARAKATLEGDLSAAIQPAQPMIDVGAGPDCLYAQLDVANVSATTATVTITAKSGGGFTVTGHYVDVAITSTAAFAVACVNGNQALAARAASVDLSGVLVIEAGVARFSTPPTVTVTGVTVDAAGVPDVVVQMLDLGGAGIAHIVEGTTALALGPIVARSPLHLAATEVWIPGNTVGADDDVENVFVFAKDRGDGLLREQRLNSNRAASIDVIDFTASNASEASIAAARAALAGPGVIYAGSRFIDGDGNVGRTAERFWTRAE